MRVMNLERRLSGRRRRYPKVEALEPRALLTVGLLDPSFGNAGTADVLLNPDVVDNGNPFVGTRPDQRLAPPPSAIPWPRSAPG